MKIGQKIKLDWNDISSMADHIAFDASSYELDLIVGIARGGVIPAVMLSHKLGVPMETVVWQTRDGAKKETNTDVVKAIAAGQNILFVDDINDSGATFNQLLTFYEKYNTIPKSNIYTACLVEQAKSEYMTDLNVLRLDMEKWVQFPWEKQIDVGELR